jgi:hypothetical protein
MNTIHRFAVLLCAASLTVAPSVADVTYSGTNAMESSGWGWPYNPDHLFWFTQFRLKIEGIRSPGKPPKTTEIYSENFNFNCENMDFYVKFDSTEFVHGSVVVLTSIIKDNFGNEYTQKIKGRVYNKAYSATYIRFVPFETNSFLAHLGRGNFSTRTDNPYHSTNAVVLDRLIDSTVNHFNTHGTVAELTSINDLSNTDQIILEDVLLDGKRRRKTPPISFSFISACHAFGLYPSQNTVLANYMGIYSNSKNKAVVGFNNYTNGFRNYDWFKAFLAAFIDEKYTVQESIDKAFGLGYKLYGQTDENVGFLDNAYGAALGFSIKPVLEGDPKTKIRGLYVIPKGNVKWARVVVNAS